ncbi:MAG: hypothetical protein AB7Q45_11760 [Planctomycetaceae bacterium]
MIVPRAGLSRPASAPSSARPSSPPQSIAQHPHAVPRNRPPTQGESPQPGPGHGRGGHYDPRYPHSGRPIVIPQIYGFPPPAPPGYGDFPPPPASLSGQIEAVPVIVPLERSRSRAMYQVIPLDPVPQPAPVAEPLLPPSRPGYFELPPPPE